MFESLTARFEGVFDRLRGRGRLSEDEVNEALAEVRLALLEADVNVEVVHRLLDRIRTRAIGAEVLKSVAPGHQVVKVVHESLVETLGREAVPLASAKAKPLTTLMVGCRALERPPRRPSWPAGTNARANASCWWRRTW